MLSTRGATLYQGFMAIADGASDYFSPWTYNTPMVVKVETNAGLHRVQQSMMKCIRHFVEQYDSYRELMPVTDKIYDVLSLCRHKPYRIGTYRTDFVLDEAKQIKLIEITCRFALNGFFTSGFLLRLAERYLADKPHITKIDDYTPFYDDLMAYFWEFDHVCLLKGADNRNETKFVVSIFEHAGFPVHVIPADAVSENIHLFEHAAVIGELDHNELCRLPFDTIAAIIDAQSLNDLRTVFLIHDKRFFTLLTHDAFLHAALSDAEIEELRPYLIPTYTRKLRPDIWEQARREKDRWIMKPFALGKSIDVFAGCVTPEDEWQSLFTPDRWDKMVLQPFITQPRFRGAVKDQPHHDYIVGTLLFFEEQYYGPGLFRASSHPVTNKVDDRKVAPLVTADTADFAEDFML